MFGIEQESRRAVLTLEGGKVITTLYFPKTNKPMLPEEMERKFVEGFKKSQPHTANKVVKCHLMRN